MLNVCECEMELVNESSEAERSEAARDAQMAAKLTPLRATQLALTQKPRDMLGLKIRLRIARRLTLLYSYIKPLVNSTKTTPEIGLTSMERIASEERLAMVRNIL